MFNLTDHVDEAVQPLLTLSEGRMELTKYDPLLFAVIYLQHHITLMDENEGDITFSEFHTSLVDYAKGWVSKKRRLSEYRDAFIAPRECGKSTWLFLILPLWAAAHGHVKFIAAFSDSGKQAEQHLATFKHELDTNALLRQDYPKLVEPLIRSQGVAKAVADNRYMIHQANNFVFMAKGMDSASLGMKVGNQRPDLLILDDIEGGEATYSSYQIEQRLKTVQDVIFPLNLSARVVISGTTTMPGSIIHQIIESQTENVPVELRWVSAENIKVHYFPAIITDEDTGLERSLWPEKWPLTYLHTQRATNPRPFLKNFMNRPLLLDGQFWGPEDIHYESQDFYGNTILSLDPAVTSSKTSDFTGIAVVSRDSSNLGPAFVRWAGHGKFTPQAVKKKVEELLYSFPEIGLILVETNQGGDLWTDLFKDVPIKVRTIHQKEPKPVRAQTALNFYQTGKVFHTERFQILEQELLGFPNTAHDDALDAVTTAINYFLKKSAKKGTSVMQKSYI